VGFVVDKVALGQVFSENFGFPCQFLFHQFLHYNHLGLAQQVSTQSSTRIKKSLIKIIP
jgi:hypothetical protein